MLNFTVNEVTGRYQATLPGKLVSISQQRKLNVNQTPYYLATVEIEKADGNKEQVTSIIYESNYMLAMEQGGFKIGTSYLTTATIQDDDSILFQTSHLAGAKRLTASDLGFIKANVQNVLAPEQRQQTSAQEEQKVVNAPAETVSENSKK